MFNYDYIPFCIHKIDSITKYNLPGAVFELVEYGGAPWDKNITNNFGIIKFWIPRCSSFVLKEIISPIGYQPNDQTYQVWIDEDGDIYVNNSLIEDNLTIENTPLILANFTVIKVDKTNNKPLTNAKYNLIFQNKTIATNISNINGEVSFYNLVPGVYELVEIEAPSGFKIDDENLPVLVTNDGKVTICGVDADGYLLTNTPIDTLTFINIDLITNKPLGYTIFQLSKEKTIIASAISNTNGIVDFGLLDAGIYELVETKPSPGYRPNKSIYQVVVLLDDEITINNSTIADFNIKNIPLPKLQFTVLDAQTKELISHAIFRLSQNNTIIKTITSDHNGLVDFGLLNTGNYQLTEVISSDGYLSNNIIYNVIIDNNGDITINDIKIEDFSIANTKANKLIFNEIDSQTKQPLAKAVFQLIQNNNIINTAISDINGKVDLDFIDVGGYELQEIITPEGYLINNNIYQVKVANDGIITIDNIPIYQFVVENTKVY